MSTARDAYENDPVFRRLVDVIHSLIMEAELTPTEVRQAAVLACIKHEQITARSQFIAMTDMEAALHRELEGLAP